MSVIEKKQMESGKKLITSSTVSVTRTILDLVPGEKADYTVYDFGIETARGTAAYLKKKGRGEFKVTKTGPTTFSVSRIK